MQARAPDSREGCGERLDYATPVRVGLIESTPEPQLVLDREAKLSVTLGLLFFIPVVPAVAAIVLGVRARKRLAEAEHGYGRRAALVGIICGVISLVIFMAGVLTLV